jgi:CRISPR-associated protein Csx3
MNSLPALLIGGPPHCGKSVLSHSLSQALIARKCEHYVLRVAPDGEGHYSQEADAQLVRQLRVKHLWTESWIEAQCRYIARRPLPLIVDMGGRPDMQSLTLFDQCTHALLLTRDESARQEWQGHATAHGLQIIADITSVQGSEGVLAQREPLIRGTVSNLERGEPATGAVFDALVDRVAELFHFTPEQLRQTHFGSAPFWSEIAIIDFWALARHMYPDDPLNNFRIEEIDKILAEVPAGRPIAAYGRMPMWLAGAISRERDVRWHFDMRNGNGWVQPVVPKMCKAGDNSFAQQPHVSIQLEVDSANAQTALTLYPAGGNLNIEDAHEILLPYISPEQHLVIKGPVPYWLLNGMIKACAHCASVRALQVQHQT